MAYTKYSLTPSNNNAAPPDGAPEGMLPSAVNDTMRDMMAQIRDVGDGIRGGTYTMTAPVITGGSINGAVIGGSTPAAISSTNLAYTGTLTGGTGVVNLGSGQFYKDASGNLGIGVTPSAWSASDKPIQIGAGGALVGKTGTTSQVNLSANFYFDGTNNKYIGTNFASLYSQLNGEHLWYSAPSGTAGNNVSFTERMRIDSSGNVGIGTSSPSSASNRTVLTLNNNAWGGQLNINVGATNHCQFGTDNFNSGQSCRIQSQDGMVFYTGGANERMRIDSSGNLLVGTTSTIASTGSCFYNGGANYALAIARNSGSLQGNMAFINGTSIVGAVNTTTVSTVYATSSDYRLKDITGNLAGYKERIMALQPKQGSWKTDGSEFKGFIAHEFAQQYPNAVSGKKDAVDKDGKPVYQGMQAGGSETIADLVALIQEQQTIIETLTTRLNALEGK